MPPCRVGTLPRTAYGGLRHRDVETLAAGSSLRLQRRLVKRYGGGRWRKMKGVAMVRLSSRRVVTAEIHWYEAHGIGRRELKIKRLL